MKDDILQRLKAHFGDKLLENFPLSTITTVQTGGKASGLIKVKSQKELLETLDFLKSQDIPFLIVGGGSNLLFSDNGFADLIVKNEATGIETIGNIIRVQSGTALQDLVDFTINNGLSGMHKLTGIPGTVGGAVYGNAGAYGQTISDHLVSVTIWQDHQLVKIPLSECQFDYRTSIFKTVKNPIIETEFALPPEDSGVLKIESAEILEERLKRYPIGIKCPGSFFTNVPFSNVPKGKRELIPDDKIRNDKVYVGWLLESVGAKGLNIGGVTVAHYHGNLFINQGAGTSTDYLQLAEELIKRVKEKYGLILTPEVQILA